MRFKMAPKAKRLPTCPCCIAASKVSTMPSSENSRTYKSEPMVLAMIPTVKPIINSFLTSINKCISSKAHSSVSSPLSSNSNSLGNTLESRFYHCAHGAVMPSSLVTKIKGFAITYNLCCKNTFYKIYRSSRVTSPFNKKLMPGSYRWHGFFSTLED